MDLSKKIKELRKAKGISQAKLAEIIGISQSAVNYFENKGSELTISQLEKIASALGVSLQYLLFGEEQKNCNECKKKLKNLKLKYALLVDKIRIMKRDAEVKKELRALNMAKKATFEKEKFSWFWKHFTELVDTKKLSELAKKYNQDKEIGESFFDEYMKYLQKKKEAKK